MTAVSVAQSVAQSVGRAIASMAAVSGGGYPANLAFYAWDTQAGVYDSGVIVGTGSIAEATTSTRYYPDASNVWQPFGSGVVGQYYHDGDWWYPFHCAWTNSCTRSYDLTNASWTKTNATAALNQTGMRGDANGASLLTATGASGTAIFSAVVAASADHGSRWFLKRSVGTGTVEITMDNGATWTNVTTALAAASGWYEAVMGQTLANPQFGIRLATSGDAVIVGNAELALVPGVSSSAVGIMRWNSPIFTAGATGSVTQPIPTVSGANQDGTIGFYYTEAVFASPDADYGLTDIYFPSFSATSADATACNFANGTFFSQQFLQPAVGGSTNQITRSIVAGDRIRIASWYNAGESSASQSVDGDITQGSLTFSSFDSDGSMFLIRRQTTATCGAILLRNYRRYVIANLAEGATQAIDLINGTKAWGQNIVALSRRLDLYTQNGNPWTATGATAVRDAVGIGGVANTACTVNDPDASLRIFRQVSLPTALDTANYALRFFVRKDAITSRFPEFQFQLTGGTPLNVYVSLNTSTGAIAARTGPLVFTAQTYAVDTDFWEVAGDLANNGTNTSIGILMYPAYSATLGGASSAALTGSVVIGNVEIYKGVTAASVLGNAPAYTPQTKAPEVNPS